MDRRALLRFVAAITLASTSLGTAGCAGKKTQMHATAVTARGVRVSPSDVFFNGSVLVVKVNVLNQAKSPVTLDRDASRLTLPDGKILTPSSHAKTQTLDPDGAELVRIDFRSDGFKWKDVARAQLSLGDAVLVGGAPASIPPMDLTVGEVRGAPLATIEKDRITIAEQIQFRTGSAEILAGSEPIVDAVAEILASHPAIAKLRVEGHTDNQGNAASNLDLSKRRAASVVAALVARGIARGRLASNGFGDTKPLDVNTTDEGRQRNRRVEFHIE